MCIFIHKPADKRISYRTLRRAYHANQHGWGIVAKDADGNLTVARGLGKVGSLIEAYKEVENQEVLIHCRIKTSGEIDLANTHPFEIIDGAWLMHNGVLSEKVTGKRDDKTKSDTWYLANKILRPMFLKDKQHLFLKYPEELKFREDLEEYIEPSSTNKVAIMSKYGPTVIAGRRKGEERDGVWYSNASAFRTSPEYKRRTSKPRTVSGATTGGTTYTWQGGSTYSGTQSHSSTNGSQNGVGQTNRQCHSSTGPSSNGSSSTGSGASVRPSTSNPRRERVGNHPIGTATMVHPGHEQKLKGRSHVRYSEQLETVQLEVSEELDHIAELEKHNQVLKAEDARYLMAFTYGEILRLMELHELQDIVLNNPEGIAEVLYYAVRGELYFNNPDEQLFDNDLLKQEGTPKDEPKKKKLTPQQEEDQIEAEAGYRAAKVFQLLWDECEKFEMQKRLLNRA